MSDARSHQLQYTKDITIPVPWGHFALKIWGPDEGIPVLALHGWQDNAGTFDTLAPLLPPYIRLVCLDFCGHGLSSGYTPGMFINYNDHVYHIKIVFDYFKWKKVIIMGHSMGAMAGLKFTSLFPELVEKFISLDVIKQYSSEAELLPVRMKGVFMQFQELCAKMDKGATASTTYEKALERLVHTYGGSIDEKDAEILLIRGLRKRSASEAELTRDMRTILRPYLFHDFTTEQLKAMSRRVTCPLLIVRAKRTSVFESLELWGEFLDIYREYSKDFRYVEVDGRHHVHLSRPELVAPHIWKFLPPIPSKL